jgi:hypothetical protein
MVVQRKIRFADTAAKITSPFFKPHRSRGAKHRNEKHMDEMLAALDVLSIANAPSPAPSTTTSRYGGFLFFPDLFELQHMVCAEDQATSATAFRLSAHLKEAELTFSELVSDYSFCCGNDESAAWLHDLSADNSSREDYINSLISRAKELMVDCLVDLRVLDNVKMPFLATETVSELVNTTETENWLSQKAVDLANARFASEEDGKDVAIVFNHRDSSFLEVNSTSMYREDIRVSCIGGESKCVVDTPHDKTDETSNILREISTRYISDDDHVYIYRRRDVPRGQLTEAYLHITDDVLFVWFSYA